MLPTPPSARGEKGPGVPVADLETEAAQNGQGEADDQGFVRGVKWDDFRQMRDLSHKAGTAQKELAEARKQIAVLQTGLTLKPKQVTALFAAHDGEMTPDALRATAIDLGFAEPPEDEEAPELVEARAQAQQVQRATAGASPPGKGPLLTAAHREGWTQEKWARFAKAHPEHFETLMRDPTASVPNPGGTW